MILTKIYMIIARIRWISPTNRRFLTKIRLVLPKIKHQVDRLQEEEAGQERHHGRGGGAVGVQRGILGHQEGGQLGGQDRRDRQFVVVATTFGPRWRYLCCFYIPWRTGTIFYIHNTITMSNIIILLSLLDIFIRLFIKLYINFYEY